MACEACEFAQQHICDDEEAKRFYVRVGDGNVELVGCETHVRKAVLAIRHASDVVEIAEALQRATPSSQPWRPITGASVVITAEKLGAVDPEKVTRFLGVAIAAGTRATVLMPIRPGNEDGWWMLQTDDGFYVPAAEGMFEASR